MKLLVELISDVNPSAVREDLIEWIRDAYETSVRVTVIPELDLFNSIRESPDYSPLIEEMFSLIDKLCNMRAVLSARKE